MEKKGNAQTDARRVLVVDDHAASADLLLEILSLEGYSVRVAHCGRDGLAIAREFEPRIALLDISLPDMDGFALLKLFKADPQLRRIRLVALSGYGPWTDPKSCGEDRFDRYLVKPVDVGQLLSVLESLA